MRLLRMAVPGTMVLAILSTAVPAAAGAWLADPGAYYLKISGSYLYSTERFDSEGNVITLASGDPGVLAAAFRDMSITTYLEYGVAPRATLIVQVPWKALTNWETQFTTQFNAIQKIEAVSRGMTDLRTGVRVPLRTDPFPVSVEGLVKLPLGYDPDPPETLLPPLGSGKVDFDIVLLAGTSLWPFPGYINARAGYRLRGGGLDDELLATLEAGTTWRRFFGKAALDATYTTGELADADPTRVVTNENIFKVLGEINYSVTSRLAVSAEVFHVLRGANTVAGTTWALGVVVRRPAAGADALSPLPPSGP